MIAAFAARSSISTSTHTAAPLKSYAIEAEAKALIGVAIETAQQIRNATGDLDVNRPGMSGERIGQETAEATPRRRCGLIGPTPS